MSTQLGEVQGGLRSSVRTGELHRLIDPGTLDEVLNEVMQKDLGGLRPTLPEPGGETVVDHLAATATALPLAMLVWCCWAWPNRRLG